MKFSSFARFGTAFVVGLLIFSTVVSQGPPPHVRKAVSGTENMLISEGLEPLENYIDEVMVPDEERNREEWIERLKTLRQQLRPFVDGVAVERAPDGVLMILSGSGEQRKLSIVLTPDGVSDLVLVEGGSSEVPAAESWGPVGANAENLGAILDRMEAEGYSGVAFLKVGDSVVVHRGFGMADRKRGIPNSPDKIFGVGSRPIDFTVAAIQLLAQQGKLKLDDPITRFFENVPEDKSAMTLRHLLTGQSGLPDFFDTEEDADPDLTWINRKTAEQRILNQQLLFAPGTSEAHSHGAFVFLSAVVERVSGKPYYSFIRENFLDPAGMTKTGEYGESRGLSVDDFAVGVGGSSVGIPNIPPNWGPTSWLIKGSGGMYSNLDDLRRFYKYVRSGKVLDTEHRRRFDSMSVNLDGSERGYELFSVYIPPDRELFIFFNELKDFDRLRRLFRELNQSLAPAGARMKKQTN